MVGELSRGSFWDRDEGLPEALTGGWPRGQAGATLCMRG